MIRLPSHRYSWPALCAAIAVLIGTGAGMATVGDLHQRSYGPDDPLSVFDSPTPMAMRTSATDDGGYGDAGDGNCAQCSERDRGYRWAVLAVVRFPEQCPSDSWGFRRGCLDFVGGT